jgi:hypothetical protein
MTANDLSGDQRSTRIELAAVIAYCALAILANVLALWWG